MNKQKRSFLLAFYLFLTSCLTGCSENKNDTTIEAENVTPSTSYYQESDYTTSPTEIVIIGDETSNEIVQEIETEPTEVIEITEPTEEIIQKKEIILSLDEVAFLTIGGKYGYGDVRRDTLTNLGYDYDVISKRVTELLNGDSYSIPDRNTYNYNFGYVKNKVDVYDSYGNREGSLSAYQKFIITDNKVEDMTLVLFRNQTFYLKNNDINKIADSHLEIDISEQKVYFYLDGELVLEANVVTGHPDKGTTHGTNLGITEVLRISYNVTFDGGKMSKVFILFNWDGEGFHDASWREEWEFNDNTRYLSAGSNGCCNMKEDDVFFIEENTYMGMPVLIHN